MVIYALKSPASAAQFRPWPASEARKWGFFGYGYVYSYVFKIKGPTASR
jgi:hypothetical protein